jgi:hypothetical protein
VILPVRVLGSALHSWSAASAVTDAGSASGLSHVVRWWKTVPGVGTTQRVDRDVVLVQLSGQAGGEPLERGLAHSVDGAAAPGERSGRHRGMPGRAG